QAAVLLFDMRRWAEFYPHRAGAPMFSRLSAEPLAGAPRTAGEPLLDRLARTAPSERPPLLRGWLRGEVSRVLRLAESKLDDDAALTSLGMDSLMGLELKHRMKREADVEVPM